MPVAGYAEAGWGSVPRTSLHGPDGSNVSISRNAHDRHRAGQSRDVPSVSVEQLLSSLFP